MKNKRSLIMIAVATLVLILGAAALYNSLSDRFADQSLVALTPSVSQSEPNMPPSQSDSEEVSRTDAVPEPVLAMAPDFTVYDTDGNAVKLSDFIGKPVVLNFWASWCGPCKNEMPHFQAAYEKYGEDVHFLMINLTDGYQETKADADRFISQSGYTFPVYYDSDSIAAMAYGTYSIPVTYFIDREGHGIAYYPGSISPELLELGIVTIS